MLSSDPAVTIEDAAAIIENDGDYKTITIASFTEKDGNYTCKLKVPSPRSQSGFTFYPPIDKESPCPTKREAILRCLKHIQCTGAMNFPGQTDKSTESKSSKKLVIPKRKYTKTSISKDEAEDNKEETGVNEEPKIPLDETEIKVESPQVTEKSQALPDSVPLLF